MGGGSNNSSQQAQQQYDQQQAAITQSQAGINALFNDPSRTAQYDKLGADTTQYYTDDVNRQNTIAGRNLKFSLARSGLTGGSQQAAEGQQLGQDYQKGLLQASQQGQTAESNLKASDEQSRTNLLAMAQSGLDATTGASQSSLALQNNLLAGQAGANANQLGDLFGNLSDVYTNSQNTKAARQGMLYGYGSIFSPMYGPGSTSSYGGGGGYS